MLILVVAGLILATGIRADNDEPVSNTDLLELSLSELLSISVASKREESVSSAPAVVSVVTAEDIRRQGYTSLREILNRQPHLQITGSTLFPSNKAVVRGVSTSHSDNHVLFQINGRPVRDATVSSLSFDLYSFFPVSAIKKIEIVRGPGSVLYGTNAFAGVINIVTYDGASANDAELSLTQGSFDTQLLEASGAIHGKSARLFGAIYHVDSAGDEIDDISDQFGQVGSYPMGRDGTQGLLRFDWGGFSIDALYSNSWSDNARLVFSYPSTQLGMERRFVDMGYTHDFNSDWRIAANYSFTGTKLRMTTLPSPAVQSTGIDNNHFYEMVLSGALGRKTNLVLGTSFSQAENNGATDFVSLSRSTFAQFDYQMKDDLKLVAGGQYNVPDVADASFSPRLGVVANFAHHWNAKLLYSSAFREASPLDRFTNLPATVGNPDLKPETIDTLDFQLSYDHGPSRYALSLYDSVHKDIITPVPGTPITRENLGEIRYSGIELEAHAQLSQRFSLFGNASYQQNRTDTGEKNVTYAPDKTLKIGGDYSVAEGIELGIFASYFSEFTRKNDYPDVNPAADAYTLVTANIDFNLERLTDKGKLKAYTVSVFLDNLLDEDVFIPSIATARVNSVPYHSGRAVYVKLKGRF